ncbi:DUF1553 domain-containing protein [Haloferula chungangensis]|uniref:DUF1553 domain-containing protein n=1 Tax=Haloferula chungangensis TaxID=1048331 RepID=A0ABW2LBB2_9BACT
MAAATSVFSEEVSFNRDIRPIISDRCFKCHGPDAKNQDSEFRLDTFEHATADLGGYFGVVPGDLDKSELHQLIHTDDEDELMPPPSSKMALTDGEKELLDAWILQGATYEKHWSFIPVADVIEVPKAGEGWARNEIDRFVAEGFERHGMEPAKESPKSKLLRRVSFDLTGLPPTLEELEAFEADTDPRAYEKVVDRLLASDAYAERMTAEWLDVARYSDSYGYQRDHERSVWPWRDWVLRAFRDNMPYSQFMKEQIAGDLIPDATEDQILATAFNRLHGHNIEGGSVLEEFRVEYVGDRVETAGTAFLGLTMNCTRCHDHKYDPLTAKDFYSMSSLFANIDEAGLISYFTEAVPTPALSLPSDAQREELRAKEQERSRMEDRYRQALASSDSAFEAWLQARPGAPSQDGLEAYLAFEEMDKDGTIANLANPDHPASNKILNVLVDGPHGKAIKVTGDDPLELEDIGAYEREQAWSAALWVNPSEIVARANILSRGKGADDSAGMGYEFLLLDGKPTLSVVHFWPGNAIRVQAKEVLKTGEWVHLGASYDGSSKASGLRIFIDGREAEVDVVRDGLTRAIDAFTRTDKGEKLGVVLGQRYRESGLRDGLIDEFRFWSREVSALEIRQAFDGESLVSLLNKDAATLTEDEKQALKEYFLKNEHGESIAALEALTVARAEWNGVMDSIPAISVMDEMSPPKKAYILERGAYDSHGEEVNGDSPGFLPAMDPALPKNRLGFAEWLVDPGNPLPSRVTVNRYWQMIFGRGLVATTEDFGNQGTLPTHPELLDWLSRDFMNHGWDVKELLKKMVLSATYRQSTEATPEMRAKDPENEFLARSHATRLTAEMIRDNALAASGLLVDKWGGPPAKPYEVEVSFEPVKPDKGDGLYRRSVYTWWKRAAAAPMLTTFDAPKRDVCTVRRDTTVSPLQSLILLNAPQFMEASRVLAVRLIKAHGDDRKALVTEAYQTLTSRLPTNDETEILIELLDSQLAIFKADPEGAREMLEVGDTPMDESVPVDRQAAATVLVNAMMNLDESLIER